MKRLILFMVLLFAGLTAHAWKIKYPGNKLYIYRYTLNDKKATRHSLKEPQKFLSRKSLNRRRKQGIAVDSTDLPIPQNYIRMFSSKETTVLGTSKWQNTVLVSSSDTTELCRLSTLPIVKAYRCVYISPDSIEKPEDIRWNVHESFNRWDSIHNDPYGMSRQQIETLSGHWLHEQGFTGRGVTIAILDGGFQNYNRIPALRETRVIGTHDFVGPAMNYRFHKDKETSFHSIDHGTKVFSTLAANAPEVCMGTAPDANYWLLRCEDPNTEQPVEEDYWTMAAEFADSVGADIINSSLGYYKFDNNRGDYRLQDLDGKTAFISRTASMLARKGIVLCNSAGNSGMGPWKKIGVPADAQDILTVGAIDKHNRIAAFSSLGPTQDGRVKPDIVAIGAPTALISGRGTLINDMGTSFSTPIVTGLVACLWQALPHKTAFEIIDLVRRSGNQYKEPTNVYGYGIPNFWIAYQTGL